MSKWKTTLRSERALIQYALMFYTRLPVPSLPSVDQSIQDHASRYFPLIGWLIGGLAALSYYVLHLYLPHEISVLLSMCFSIWLTGAFHEDGLADSCDGLGGGWDKSTILNIMKDSRIGTYGFVGLSAVLALKFMCLSALPPEWVPVALLVGHVTSRWCSNVVMWRMSYVRLDETSKAKPITKGFASNDFFIATLIALLSVILLPTGLYSALLFLTPFTIYFCYQLRKWLGGYTGDALGAVQQLAEVGFYLGMVVHLV